MQRIIDPKYHWTGPLGTITKESNKFILSDDGNLEIYNVKGSDSGRYTCKVKYIDNTEQMTTEIHFMVYVYHIPDKSIYLSSEFTAGTCKTNTVVSYEKYLLEKLESLISNLNCEIKQWSVQCHTSTDTLEKITYKLTVQFGVFPFMLTVAEACKGSQCENSTSNIRKAYENIKEFFEAQKTDSSHTDHLHFIPGTLTGVKVDHCKPGFGKNINVMNNNTVCPGCCVACPPGRFSAKYDTVCILCPAGSYNERYAQVECENCPEAESSDGKGAKTESQCHRILPMWMAFLISSAATCIILVTTWAIIIKCCKKTIAAQYIREAESDIKKRLQEFANIASDTEIQEQRNKLSPIKLQGNKGDFLEEESMALLSTPSTSSPLAGTSLSPDQTRLSELETSFEDHSSPTLENKNNVVPNNLPHNQQRLIGIMKTNLP
ncbi:zona pellucida-binding protein 2-like [Sceloporus undulatus]|uniref:zona pellucida-binding protein 2-like n=1 Tax=Sceloporus undulatus TaxID=8520 RepID=UPI001C4A8D3E|nr:zona pellucida-binding protein 2-like [Sceloporus undulatus]